ncbi:MAG: TolC family protein [Alistipes sp.]|nr:TolC family protein [Alistipes sp.]
MRLTLIILAACSLSAAHAQVTLDDYRRDVASYSRQLRIAQAASREAAEELGKARTGYLPELRLDGDFAYAFRRTSGVRAWSFAVQPRVVQLIYGGGSVRRAVRRAELSYDIALCDEEFAAIDVRYAADYAYWNLSAMERYRDAMREYVAIIASLQRIVDERFAEGYIAKGDVLMIEARMSEAEYGMVTAEQNYEVALHNFNILRGVDAQSEVDLAQTILDSLPMPGRVALDEVLVRRSDLAAVRLAARSAREGIGAARAAYNPQLRAGVGGAWRPLSPNVTGRTQVDGSVFVELGVPIFHGGERRRATAAARAAYERAEWQAARMHDDVVREEMNGWTTLVESGAQVASTTRSLRIAGENLALGTYSYNEGLATILDVMQAQLSWIQLYTNSITARYNYAVALAAYERVTAVPVEPVE